MLVLSLHPSLHVTFSRLINSCWASIESGVQRWQPSDRTLHLETTTYAASGMVHEETIYAVAKDGEVTRSVRRAMD